MGFYLAQLLTGLANASSLFLIASGLSIIFGVTRIVNFAHGSLYMLGAYIAFSLTATLPLGIASFWLSVLAAAAVVAVIGAVIEVGILRRIYRAPELYQLVATFGVVLIVQDLTLAIWGADDRFGPRAPGLDSAVRIFGEPVPEYDLALIAAGPLVLLAIWLLFHRTRWGILLRAATQDREMVGALGVNQAWLFTSAFMLGAFLAGLGGALQLPRESINLQMDLNIIAEAFVVVVIGGMGSVLGAFLAAIAISVLNAFAVLQFPQLSIVLPFAVMAIVLVLRPYGLLGKPGSEHGAPVAPEAPMRRLTTGEAALVAALILIFAISPALAPGYLPILLVDVSIAMLFAASLHFLMGVGGMVSFGHAATFGVGAYAAALFATLVGLPMLPSIALATIFAGAASLLIGWFCVRLSGVYLAMLSLAAAQILWSTAIQWQEVTGGDDGILGIWPPGWAQSDLAYFYVAFAVCFAGLWALRHAAHTPFGYALRGIRDSRLRAEAIGLNAVRHQWFGYTFAGTFAGLAGATFVFAKGSVFPDTLSIGHSVDALIMVLLGGVHALAGPVIGAGAFVLLEDWITRFDYWRFVFGALILCVVLLVPDGLAGALSRIVARFRPDAGRNAA